MTDRLTERLAIAFLGVLALATVVGGIVLAWNDRSLPGEIIAIGSAAAGVIGGMFSKIGQTDPQPVVVANDPTEAVPVVEAPKPRVRKRT